MPVVSLIKPASASARFGQFSTVTRIEYSYSDLALRAQHRGWSFPVPSQGLQLYFAPHSQTGIWQLLGADPQIDAHFMFTNHNAEWQLLVADAEHEITAWHSANQSAPGTAGRPPSKAKRKKPVWVFRAWKDETKQVFFGWADTNRFAWCYGQQVGSVRARGQSHSLWEFRADLNQLAAFWDMVLRRSCDIDPGDVDAHAEVLYRIGQFFTTHDVMTPTNTPPPVLWPDDYRAWWAATQKLPRDFSHPDLSRANIDTATFMYGNAGRELAEPPVLDLLEAKRYARNITEDYRGKIIYVSKYQYGTQVMFHSDSAAAGIYAFPKRDTGQRVRFRVLGMHVNTAQTACQRPHVPYLFMPTWRLEPLDNVPAADRYWIFAPFEVHPIKGAVFPTGADVEWVLAPDAEQPDLTRPEPKVKDARPLPPAPPPAAGPLPQRRPMRRELWSPVMVLAWQHAHRYLGKKIAVRELYLLKETTPRILRPVQEFEVDRLKVSGNTLYFVVYLPDNTLADVPAFRDTGIGTVAPTYAWWNTVADSLGGLRRGRR